MERPPSQPERIEISPELEADPTAEERAEYARLKTEERAGALMDYMSQTAVAASSTNKMMKKLNEKGFFDSPEE